MARGSGSSSGSSSGGLVSVRFDVKFAVGAVVFAVFYGIMLLYYLARVFGNPTTVLLSLASFCAIRVISFAMRAVLDGSYDYPGIGIAIVYRFSYSVGISVLLFATHFLIRHRGATIGNATKNPIGQVSRYLIPFLLSVAIILGVTAWAIAGGGGWSTYDLQKAYIVFFLVITIFLGMYAVVLLHEEQGALARAPQETELPGKGETHGVIYVPIVIVTLLLLRALYLTIMTMTDMYQTEAQWYCLGPLPELLAVFLFAVPGLIPNKRDLSPSPPDDKGGLKETGSA